MHINVAEAPDDRTVTATVASVHTRARTKLARRAFPVPSRTSMKVTLL